jgi:hypothetical protein
MMARLPGEDLPAQARLVWLDKKPKCPVSRKEAEAMAYLKRAPKRRIAERNGRR